MAQYAIIRMQKFNMSAVQGIQKHNQRQGKSNSNKDVDYERSHLNYDLINDRKLQYERIIKDEIAERVARKPRANSVVLSEFLVTASPEYMQSLTEDEQKRYFEKSLDFIRERYGERNTLYAVVHQDEANPHMHVGVLPITEDGRLSAKDIYTRTELKNLQNDFPAEMQRHGFEVERGKEGSKEKHLSPNAYKEKQDLEKDIQRLESELSVKKNELKAWNEKVPDEVEVSPKRQMKKVEVKSEERNLFGVPKKEIQKKPTGNVILPEKEFKELVTAAKENKQLKGRMEKILSTDLAKQNAYLVEQVRDRDKRMIKDAREIIELRQENRELREENRSLEAENSLLMNEITSIYETTKEFIRERAEGVRAFQNAFRSFVDGVKEKVRGGRFERLYSRENTFSMDNVREMGKSLRNLSPGRSRGHDLER